MPKSDLPKQPAAAPVHAPARKPGSGTRRPGFVFTDWAMI